MLSLARNKDWYGLSLALLITVLIGWQEFISPAIGVFILVFLLELFWFRKLKFTFSYYVLLFPLLFLLYAIALFWSSHPEIGSKLLEYKMSFFIFGILFLFQKSQTNAWLILQGLIWGSFLLAARIYLGYFSSSDQLSEYEVSNQLLRIHPSYACIYYTITICFLLLGTYSNKLTIPKWLAWMLVFTLLFFIYRLGSFAGFLFLGLLAIGGLSVWLSQKIRWYGVLGIWIVCSVLFVTTVLKLDRFAYDVEMSKAVWTEMSQGKEYYIQKNIDDNSGTKMRMLMWILSVEIIAENPLGVGTGDIDFHIQDKCDKYGLKVLKAKQLNPHNQYLQTGIDIGVPGIVILLLIILVPLVSSVRKRAWFLVLLVSSLGFNALFESVLQKQAGIVFYTLLILLVYQYRSEFSAAESTKRES